MKARVYVRVAKAQRGARRPYKVDASHNPNHSPIYHNTTPLPTVAFALDVEIPDAAFRRAEQVIAEITIPDDALKIAAEVKIHDPR